MKERKSYQLFLTVLVIMLVAFTGRGYGQAELEPWGNLSGIRIDGQLMAFGSGIRILGKDGVFVNATAKERQQPHYARQGNTQVVTTRLDSVYITEKVEDQDKGVARVSVQLSAHADVNMGGAFFSITLPAEEFTEKSVQLIQPKEAKINEAAPVAKDAFIYSTVGGVRLSAPRLQLELVLDEPGLVIARKENEKGKSYIRIYIPVQYGDIHNGEAAQRQLTIRAAGPIDREPVSLTLNTAVSGSPFEGFGGNFRLQNAAMDPQVIDYCLKNMRVAWGRVELPWALWQPVKNSDPIDSAKSGRLNPRVNQAMEMAQRLSKMGIPLILSAWFPPRWAIVGSPSFRPRADGVWGNPLDKSNMSEIYKSIADYIEYLRQHYGVEIKLFSFNESDLGINVRQTGVEHAALIKGLGSYLAGRGLKTKMLLGDNSDANSYSFIDVAMADPEARPYIGAISFHSWRGWEKETLEKWANAARKLDLPLIVGEGSIDAAAWNYPAIFSEPTYALQEINLYIRLLAICEPLTILQWQLTSDYSPLIGGGLFGNTAPLTPTQRFWNLKQLASTPKGLLTMPISSDRPDITCAALGNNGKRIYSIHLVNNGATRETTLKGLPKKLKSLRIILTDRERGMKEGAPIPVSDGVARFSLEARTYTELVSE